MALTETFLGTCLEISLVFFFGLISMLKIYLEASSLIILESIHTLAALFCFVLFFILLKDFLWDLSVQCFCDFNTTWPFSSFICPLTPAHHVRCISISSSRAEFIQFIWIYTTAFPFLHFCFPILFYSMYINSMTSIYPAWSVFPRTCKLRNSVKKLFANTVVLSTENRFLCWATVYCHAWGF